MAKKKVLESTTSQVVEVSQRERRLREQLLTVDEDLVLGERRLRRNSERRKLRLAAKINKARTRQTIILDRHDKSRLYQRSHIIYYLVSPFFAVGRFFRGIYQKMSGRLEHHRQTTPHRSFYLTTHAQAVRQINISGYLHFCGEVWQLIWDNKRLYLKTLLLLTLVLLSIIGLNAQGNYVDMRDALQQVGLGWLLETTGLVTQAVITSTNVSDANKQTFALVVLMFSWLTSIYLARHLYAGKIKIKLRDALYNSGGPFIPLLGILLVFLLQLLPLAIVLISYSAVTGAGYINEGIKIENMAVWCAIAVVGVLTLYWMITTLFAAITVTIPGIYPLQAYFETSVLMSGRRVKILLRILMMLLPLVVVWLLILIPVVSIDAVVKFKSFPFVQLVTTLLVAMSLIWISVYLYMLYRRLLDSPEQPIGTRNSRFVWPWLRKKRATVVAEQVENNSNNANGGEQHESNNSN